jgi:glycosyltransferase involved in cell wall biosynthesis
MLDFKPKVTVIILTYNAKSTLGNILDEAISSALDQDYENIEVIVVDNGSFDNTYDHLKLKYGAKIKVIKFSRNYGYCLGNNLALRYVSSDTKYVLFQNSDAILSRNYIKELVKILENNANVVAAQGLEIQPINKWIRVGGGSLNIAGYSVDIMPQLSSGVQQIPLNRLIVVDKYSNDGTVELVKQYFRDKSVIVRSNAGIAHARYIGYTL